MKEEKLKSIRFTVGTDEKIEKLCLKLGRNKLQLFNQMVDYFLRSGKDPADTSDELLKKALSRNHDTYTSFIKAQEKLLLIPIRQDVSRMINSQEQIVKYFNEQVLKVNKELLGNQQEIIKHLTETAVLMKNLREEQQGRSDLKMKFLYILNSYIKARDSFGFTTSAKEKEELILDTQKLITKL
ncbi:hypothetical protein H9X96_13005 [Pedobacter sp. N36a]|uniref:BfmA/BtgA family mobilization protein n=1 Tax=Pedobacter sp. N36a TaxID=2767996 RepID=UPI001656D572|nr:BfmA/BtgA family mobilization protein [Pedobacter sp. N36a]MBC8986696.1 hypothetical protein [Pedobacter sp. N36a]